MCLKSLNYEVESYRTKLITGYKRNKDPREDNHGGGGVVLTFLLCWHTIPVCASVATLKSKTRCVLKIIQTKPINLSYQLKLWLYDIKPPQKSATQKRWSLTLLLCLLSGLNHYKSLGGAWGRLETIRDEIILDENMSYCYSCNIKQSQD